MTIENANSGQPVEPPAPKSGRRNSLVWIVVIVAVALMLALAPYLARHGRNNSVNQSSELKGKVAPEFALESLDGKTVRLGDFRG